MRCAGESRCANAACTALDTSSAAPSRPVSGNPRWRANLRGAETQHRKLAQGIDEGTISYEVLVSAAENVLGDNFLGGGIDAEDFAGDVIGPLLAAPAAALGQGVEIILRPVYEVFQQVPGLGVCN